METADTPPHGVSDTLNADRRAGEIYRNVDQSALEREYYKNPLPSRTITPRTGGVYHGQQIPYGARYASRYPGSYYP